MTATTSPQRVPVVQGRPGGASSPFARSGTGSLLAHLVKLVVLAGVVALAVFSLPALWSRHLWLSFVIVSAVTLLILWAYLSPRQIALKYLLPGTLLLLVFQVYPIADLIRISFTNQGDGHMVSERSAAAQTVADSIGPVPNGATYGLAVATTGNPARPASLVLFLTTSAGKVLVGDSHGLVAYHGPKPTLSFTGAVTAVPGYRVLTPVEVNGLGSRFTSYRVPIGNGRYIGPVDLSEATVLQATFVEKPGGSLYDTVHHVTYRPENGFFVATNGSGNTLSIGYQTGVGFGNYTSVLTDPDIRNPFLKVLAWTFAFAVLSVLGCFSIGLFLAIVLNHPRMRAKGLYRSFLLLPYAMPAFISILVWASMFNQRFGLINSMLHTNVNWLGNQWWAKVAILVTNVWLGFPYMFLISLGVLQSVSADLKEAASVDGAGGLKAFRFITFPLLLATVEPLLIASFAYNFNNFNVIQLLTGGAPFDYGSSTAGSTDLVISYTYRVAFGGSAHYGLAAALSIFLFILVGGMSFAGFRRTGAMRALSSPPGAK